jgi:hypothetical protein
MVDLGSDDFEIRRLAEKEPERIGDTAGSALREALIANPPLETQPRIEGLLLKLKFGPGALRTVRAVQVLEELDDPEALRLLQELSRGAPGARLTKEAAAAVERVRPRPKEMQSTRALGRSGPKKN